MTALANIMQRYKWFINDCGDLMVWIGGVVLLCAVALLIYQSLRLARLEQGAMRRKGATDRVGNGAVWRTRGTEPNGSNGTLRLLSEVSHDMRTILHPILGFGRFGFQKADHMEPLKIKQYFYRITVNSEELLRLVDNFMYLSRRESGRAPEEKALNDVKEIINMVLADYSIFAEEHKITLQSVINTERTSTICARYGITQLIRNLIMNAIKFSNKGESVIVELSDSCLEKEKEALKVMITNKGVPVPPAALDHLFDEYTQGSSRDAKEVGSGLGLHISHSIIEDHLGKIWAESGDDGVTRFSCLLPIK